MTTPTRDQFRGCLIGQCLGDAAGFCVEGSPPVTCRAYVQEILKTEQAGRIGRLPFVFGQYTDDSQLARELLQSYVARGAFDPADYAGRIAAIFAEHRIVGRGRATAGAAYRLINGTGWEESGAPAPSAGNGSAMRAGPVGLICFDDVDALVRVATDQGRITHQDPRCAAGAITVAGAVALVVQEHTLEPKPFLGQLAEWTSRVDDVFPSCLEHLAEWIKLPIADTTRFVRRAGLPRDFKDEWQGISPFVVGSVLWSLYSFLTSPDDYWETICTAIAVGGDVDTTAAMAGAISGAHVGLSGIPDTLARKVTDQATWNYDELVQLADQCYDIKLGGQPETPDAQD